MTVRNREGGSAGRGLSGRTRRAGSSLLAKAEADPRSARELAAARLALSVRHTLNRAFERSGLDRTGLARRMGLSLSAVCQVLDGDGNIRVATIGRYARALGYQASLRLDPVVSGAPPLDLQTPANVAAMAGHSVFGVVRLSSGNAWATETRAVEATTSRMVLQTICTPMQVDALNNQAPTATGSDLLASSGAPA
jgi:hypothetical protein